MAATVDGDELVFRYADPLRVLRGVRLQQDVRLPGELLGFERSGGEWLLRVPRPDVDRMEYSFELQLADGSSSWVVDPDHRERVGGAFGDNSVLPMPGYAAPGWTVADPLRGARRELALSSRGLPSDVPAVLWSAVGLADDEAAPLLVVHDGPEYDALACLTLFLDAMVEAGRLPPMRAALMTPLDRSETYSASATYGRALALALVPGLRRAAPSTVVVGMGASLGGLAMLQAQRGHPGIFDGLYLQSSSFFHRVLDEQESGFERFQRIAAFVDGVLRAGAARDPVPVVLSCGLIEENVENNRLMTRALQAQGYDTRLVENRDVHTYTGWRDTFDPNVVDLMAQALQARGGAR